MLEVKQFEINGKQIMFINSWRKNYSGFVHESELQVDGCYYGKAKCQYYNRTWESYPYQSVMSNLVYNLADERTVELKKEFLEENGWKKLTADRKEQFESYKNQDARYSLLKEIHKVL